MESLDFVGAAGPADASPGWLAERVREGSADLYGVARPLVPPRPIPVFWIFVLRLLAALWAADIMDEKKPLLLALPSMPSTGGVSGLVRMLESLLGPMEAEAEVLLLWVFRTREAGGSSAAVALLGTCQVAVPFWGVPLSDRGSWMGVGGVLTISGPIANGDLSGGSARFSASFAVRGRLGEGATLAAVGGSMVDRPAGVPVLVAAAAEASRGLLLGLVRPVSVGS